MGRTFTGVDESPFDLGGGTGHWSEEPVEGLEEEEPEEPTGPAPEVLEAASQIATEREEAIRSQLAQFGLSFAADGKPVIQDPGRVAEWVKPLVGTPAAAAPEPAPPPEQPKQELWEMDEEKLAALIGRVVEEKTQPLHQTMATQQQLLGRRWQDEAVKNVPQALAQFAPGMAHIAEHPEFELKFRQAIATMDAQWLENPQALAATALQTAAFMDPKKMPNRENTGSRTDAARAAFARQQPGVQNYGFEGSSPGREQHDPADDLRLRFLNKFVGPTDMAEMRALEAVDDTLTDVNGVPLHTITAYQKALAAAKRKR